jgi:polysaccharide export outer membrane protein
MITAIVVRAALAATVLVAAACAPRGHAAPNIAAAPPPAGARPSRVAAADPASAGRNLDRIMALQAQRSGDAADRDYRVGAGDVLSIKAYDLDELNQRVRVDGSGTIVLPLLNAVPVGGKTVGEVELDLTARLGSYMYHPKVTVFIEEYRSQQVAVVGAVQRPGVVAQTSRGSTVLDVISAAGGKNADASSRVYLIPVETRGTAAAPSSAALAAASAPCGPATDGTSCAPPIDGEPIVLDANETPQAAQAAFLSLPIRGGDVVIVPGNGHFVVEGYVVKPGTYALQTGLTLRGAIATAGGLSFPAEPTNVQIFRHAPNGTAETLRADLNAIGDRRTPDVYLHEGDVIEVTPSAVKLVSYGAYRLITDLVKVGARITPF